MTTDPLVSTEWLAAHLNDPRVKILDATFKMPGVLPLPKDDFLQQHIPGAVFFDVDAVSDHSNPLPHMYPSADQFGRDAGALGISSGDTVVIYDAGGWVAGPRAWWMFISFGHRDVRVLDGGLKKWRAEGRPVESGSVTPKSTDYRATLDPRRVRNKAEMQSNVASGAEQIVDADSGSQLHHWTWRSDPVEAGATDHRATRVLRGVAVGAAQPARDGALSFLDGQRHILIRSRHHNASGAGTRPTPARQHRHDSTCSTNMATQMSPRPCNTRSPQTMSSGASADPVSTSRA